MALPWAGSRLEALWLPEHPLQRVTLPGPPEPTRACLTSGDEMSSINTPYLTTSRFQDWFTTEIFVSPEFKYMKQNLRCQFSSAIEAAQTSPARIKEEGKGKPGLQQDCWDYTWDLGLFGPAQLAACRYPCLHGESSLPSNFWPCSARMQISVQKELDFSLQSVLPSADYREIFIQNALPQNLGP